MCWQLTLLQTHWYIHIVYALRKWEGRWWTCGQFPAVVVATKRARAKHCYKKTCQLRELPGIPQGGTCYLFVPWLSLLPLTCLLTPDPVTSPYWCHAAPTVHAQIAFRVHLELISEDTHSCLQTYGGCMCQPSYCMYVNAYSQYIYIYTHTEARQTTTVLNCWLLVTARPFPSTCLFIISCLYTATQHIHFLSTPVQSRTHREPTKHKQSVRFCWTSFAAWPIGFQVLCACGRSDLWSHPRPFFITPDSCTCIIWLHAGDCELKKLGCMYFSLVVSVSSPLVCERTVCRSVH